MMNTAYFSFLASAYPDEIEAKVGLIGVVVGVGCTMGPVIGSFVYNFVGFSWTFIIFGILMAPSCILVMTLGKPAQIKAANGAATGNKVVSEQEAGADEESDLLCLSTGSDAEAAANAQEL